MKVRPVLLALYGVSAALVTVQQAVLGHNNNFSVFRSASLNLMAGRDLYAAHPEQHFDLYKYSPTFALLFAPFAYVPFAVGFLGWSLLNALLLWYALDRLLPERPATLAMGLVYLEMLFAMQYGQSNALVTALLILAFLALERGRQAGAAGLLGLDAFIKIFPLGGVALAVFHPRRWRFALLCAGALVGLALVPLLVVSPHELAAQYRSWRATEAADAAQIHRGYSMMQYLYQWFGADWPAWPVQLAGTILLLLPVALGRARWDDAEFRRLFLCSLLVYLVLFNHQSERASFVIAYAGIAIWYVTSPPDRLRTAVLAFTVVVMVLHDIEVVPRALKEGFLIPYRIKGLPCLVAWVVMQRELLVRARRSGPDETVRSENAPPPQPT
ncbi:MAG TPA: glycosyltransferase family 87 protein [Gemmatimonadales bacterium]|jgi:hypothetical protein|nr:glycosyltransferase family 87 protein [Gemmatimonadales bacterium]